MMTSSSCNRKNEKKKKHHHKRMTKITFIIRLVLCLVFVYSLISNLTLHNNRFNNGGGSGSSAIIKTNTTTTAATSTDVLSSPIHAALESFSQLRKVNVHDNNETVSYTHLTLPTKDGV